MTSTLLRKSITDLTRRKARTVFTVLTLAIAVASVGIFAIPSLMNQAMQKEVQANRLPDLTLNLKPLALTRAQVAELRRLPNVTAADGRSYFQTRVWVGQRRVKAAIIAAPSYRSQSVDVVSVVSGRTPTGLSVLSSIQNDKQGRFSGRKGSTIRIIGVGDRTITVPVSGVARNMIGDQAAIGLDTVVLYSTPALLARLGAETGYSSLELRLADTGKAAADRTVAAVRRYLVRHTEFTGFSNLPELRKAGSYPGKELFDQLASIMNVFTVLALLAGLVLIANTMTTLIGEQRREIGMMKAIGGTRRQIRNVYLRTALLLGAAGSVIGVVLGLAVAYAVVRFFGSSFFAISPGFEVSLPVVVASFLVGLVAPPLAALPAIRRGSRIPVREGLEEVPALQGGQAVLDRALRRLSFLPRTAQIGIRSITRRGRRSLTTIAQIALAVGTLLAVLALIDTVAKTTNDVWNQARWDIELDTAVGTQLDARADRLIRMTPGVARAQPTLTNLIKFDGKDAFLNGYPGRPLFDTPVTHGRWFTPQESAANARVAVIASNLARATGTHVGDEVKLQTAAGPKSFRVVGVTSTQWNNGTAFYVPLQTMQTALGIDTVNSYLIQAASSDHGAIDRTTTRLEDRLGAGGYGIGTQVKYSGQRANVSQNKAISTAIGVLGLLIVAISMVGLVNAITMSVLERTREIGVLRCIGARAREIRRIFAAEGLAVSLAGWLLGIPVGYALARMFSWLLLELVGIDFGFSFPPLNVLIALIGTILLALVVMQLPLRRAVRLKPGQAIRYA
ncbi:MAG: FtsX-like permease family protein [Verrucomicrobiota bacterium]